MTDPTQDPTPAEPEPEPEPAVDPTPADAQPVDQTAAVPSTPTFDQFEELRQQARERAHEQAITVDGATFTETATFSPRNFRCSTCMGLVGVLDDDDDVNAVLTTHAATHNS